MSKKVLIAYILLILMIILGVFFLFRPKTASQTPGDNVILFVSYSCSLCHEVETYLDENHLLNKIKLEQREVHDPNNAALYVEKAKQCGIPEALMSVPLLWDGQKCYSGPREIIPYIQNNLAD